MLHLTAPESLSRLRIGAVLAGGRSRRFGTPKQLATVGGMQLVERVATAIRSAGATAVAITAPDSPELSHLLPCRVDSRPGFGPLGGLHTALIWAQELGLRGALCVACDLPFLPPPLLRRLITDGEADPGAVIAPEGREPGRVEPLCTWYPITAIPEIDRRLAAGDLALISLLSALRVRTLPLDEVTTLGEPARIFHNVNDPADRAAAEAMLPPPGKPHGRG